jgi:class 3 adenylate cyclase
VLVDAFALSTATPEAPWLPPDEAFDAAELGAAWGQELDPDFAYMGEAEGRWLLRMQRGTAAPGARCAEIERWRHTDIRAVLPAIHVPTLVLQNADGSYLSDPRNGAMLKAAIPNATLVEYPGGEQLWWYGPAETIVREVHRFTATLGDVDPSLDRVLATVLFTDIVDSTARAAVMGDRDWRTVRERHDEIVRLQLARYRGTEVKTMGDGFLATFDGPARAVRCAQAICSGVRELDIEIRAGLHTGEVELDGPDVSGIAVAIGARVGSLAGPSEVLVSQTIKDLTAGAGIAFADRGEHDLKGVPGPWRLYAAS